MLAPWAWLSYPCFSLTDYAWQHGWLDNFDSHHDPPAQEASSVVTDQVNVTTHDWRQMQCNNKFLAIHFRSIPNFQA